MKKNFISLILAVVLLSAYIPGAVLAATTDSVVEYSFNVRSLTSSGTYDNSPVVYNTSYDAADYSDYYGRKYENRVWHAWANINYDIIAPSSNWTAYMMEITNSEKIPELSKDFSSMSDSAYAAFAVKLEEDVDINNLYFIVKDKDGNIKGVPASGYVSDTEREKTVVIPFSEFANGESFMGSTIDYSKFSGMGAARKKGAADSTSSGNIYFTEMSVLNVPTVTDVKAEAFSPEIRLTFAKTELTTADKYEILITDSSGKERTETLNVADAVEENGIITWTDTAPQMEETYTYKVRVHDSSYGIYSAYSEGAEGFISEDDGGEEIPAEGDDTVKLNLSNRNYTWTNGVTEYSYTRMAKNTQNNYIEAAPIGMGEGRITQYNLSPDVHLDSDGAKEKQDFYKDYFTTGFMTVAQKAGTSETESYGRNLSEYADTGYVIFDIMADSSLDLDDLYLTIGSSHADSTTETQNFLGLPIRDFITEEDYGVRKTIAIPLSKFKLSYPGMFQGIMAYTWSGRDTVEANEIDFNYFNSIGFLRYVDPEKEYPAGAQYLYCGEMMITSVEPVTDFKVSDIKQDKVILTWEHTTDKIEKYNIYRIVDGERTFVGESTKNQFSDYNDGNAFEVGKTYTYEIEAVDKYGTPSPVQSASATIRSIDRPRQFKANVNYSQTTDVSVDISWETALFGDVQSYVLMRNGSVYKTFANDVFSFTDTEVAEHTTYTYTMKAIAADGAESILTNAITLTAASLSEPKNLSYDILNGNDIELTYDSAEFAVKYEISINGEVVDETEDTIYTVEDVPYNESLKIGVTAVNEAGAKSVTVYTNSFSIKAPEYETAQIIFDDAIAEAFTPTVLNKAKQSATSAMSIVGEKSMLCDFSTQVAGIQIISLGHKGWNVTDYRNDGGKLSFWIWADEKTNLDNLQIALGVTTTIDWSSIAQRSLLTVGDYVSEKGQWKYVEIPVSDFPAVGTAESQGVKITANMNFKEIKELALLYNNSLEATGTKIYIDNMTIEQGKQWEINSLTDPDGNEVSTTLSAGSENLVIEFSEEMNAATLNSESVQLTSADGGVNFHGVYRDKKYTINLLEALKQNTEYTLTISGAKAKTGMGGTYSVSFTTDDTEPATITYKIPSAEPVITTSTSGSTCTVTVSMPEDIAYTVKNYEFDIKFTSSELKLNGSNAVTDVIEGADVEKQNGKVTISGDNGGSILKGNIATIKFAVQKTANTKIAVEGTLGVYNSSADKETDVDVEAQKTVSVKLNSSTGSGGGGGGGSSSGSSASRENATALPTVNPIPSTSQNNSSDTTASASFTDLYEVEWAADSIKYLAGKGYVNGYEDNTFRPNNIITREEFVKMLISTMGISSEYLEHTFTDVAADAWYNEPVGIAVNKQIVSGISDTLFGVGQSITREDMCTMVYRGINSLRIVPDEIYDGIVFKDEASDYAKEAIDKLYKFGIVNGVGDDYFAPKDAVTRAMAAKILHGMELLIN